MFFVVLLIALSFQSGECLFKWTPGWHKELLITRRPLWAYHAVNDFMGYTEKETMGNISYELLRDARLKMRQIFDVKKQHDGTMAYHIGLIIGKIREKYRTMLDTYKEGQDHRHERLHPNVPSVGHFRVEHDMYFFEMIRRLEQHIDHLINVLEGIEESKWGGGTGGMLDKKAFAEKRPYGRRTNELDSFGYGKRLIDEQKVKSNVRQRYLLKRLGLPTNGSTAKKRFQRQWPVVDTWDDYFSNMY